MLVKKRLRQLAAYGRVCNRTRTLWFWGACVTGQRWNTFYGISSRSGLNQEAMLTRKTRSTTNCVSTRSRYILSESSSWQKRGTRALRMMSRYRKNSRISTMACFHFIYTQSSCNTCKVTQTTKIRKKEKKFVFNRSRNKIQVMYKTCAGFTLDERAYVSYLHLKLWALTSTRGTGLRDSC